jgi:hypothetical protein
MSHDPIARATSTASLPFSDLCELRRIADLYGIRAPELRRAGAILSGYASLTPSILRGRWEPALSRVHCSQCKFCVRALLTAHFKFRQAR